MTYKKCPLCNLNDISLKDDICDVCKNEKNKRKKIKVDDNKAQVEEYLLPLLCDLPASAIEKLTTKETSREVFALTIPLLVECKGKGTRACLDEIKVGNSQVYRYYVTPYNINGRKYHICSQWWNAIGNTSKSRLNLLKLLKAGQ